METKEIEQSYGYSWSKYISIDRWASFWYQINECIALNPKTVLEIGPGPGVLECILKKYGVDYASADINKKTNPTHLCSANSLTIPDKYYDVTVCCQCLEHLPYKDFEKCLSEIFRVSKLGAVVSLPYGYHTLRIESKETKDNKEKTVKKIQKLHQRKICKYHHWEIGLGVTLDKLVHDMNKVAKQNGFVMRSKKQIWENPYHYFFVFCKTDQTL